MTKFILYFLILSVIVIWIVALIYFVFRKNNFVKNFFYDSFLFLKIGENNLDEKTVLHYSNNEGEAIRIRKVEKRLFKMIISMIMTFYIINFLLFFCFWNKVLTWLQTVIGIAIWYIWIIVLFYTFYNKILEKNAILLDKKNFLKTSLSFQTTKNTLRNNFFIFTLLLLLEVFTFSIGILKPTVLSWWTSLFPEAILKQFNVFNTWLLSLLVVIAEEFFYRFFILLVIFSSFYITQKKLKNQTGVVSIFLKYKNNLYKILFFVATVIMAFFFFVAHDSTWSFIRILILIFHSFFLTLLFITNRRMEHNLSFHFFHNFFLFLLAIYFPVLV